jgi:hypothetical protein
LEEENSDDDILVGMTVFARTGARTHSVMRMGRLAAPRMNNRTWRASAQLRNKPFKLFANAWCRFLLWLGGR